MAIDRIPLQNSHRFPRIPESQILWAYLRMIGPGYRSNSATEFPKLERLGIDQESDGIPGIGTTRNRSGIRRNSRNWKQFPRIPRNSGITTSMGLFTNNRSWLSIQ